MSLDLDTRQRAMLDEMGVHVWWPTSAPPEETLAQVGADELQADSDRHQSIENIAASPGDERAGGQNHSQDAAPQVDPPTRASSRPAPSPAAVMPAEPAHVVDRRPTSPARSHRAQAGPTPTVLTPLPTGIEAMDWPTLQATVGACQACAMCLGRRGPVLAAPPDSLRADWLVLGEPPDDAQERTGEPFIEDAGQLLDNMLKAVEVQRYLPSQPAGTDSDNAPPPNALPDPAHTAYLSLVLKCRPVVPTAPDAQALADCAHYLRREIALVQPKVILAMGRLAMQVLLSQDHPQGLKLPLGKLRGQVWHYQGVPVVVTYPPAYLLRNPTDKARAWADLCLAAEVAQGQLPRA